MANRLQHVDLLFVVLDAIPMGLMVLTGRKIVFQNAAMTAFLSRNDEVKASRGKLVFPRQEDDARFAEVLTALHASDSCTTASEHFLLSCGAIRKQYLLTLRKISADGREKDAPPKTLIYLRNGHDDQKSGAKILRKLWNFSPSEAALAVALADRSNLKLAARARRITEGTARQYLKKIYSKTGTRGQVELVSMIHVILALI
jgi:DNA-binding CsgD family transcriptional regulator